VITITTTWNHPKLKVSKKGHLWDIEPPIQDPPGPIYLNHREALGAAWNKIRDWALEDMGWSGNVSEGEIVDKAAQFFATSVAPIPSPDGLRFAPIDEDNPPADPYQIWPDGESWSGGVRHLDSGSHYLDDTVVTVAERVDRHPALNEIGPDGEPHGHRNCPDYGYYHH
jgi:hypothetical protein